MPMPHRYVSLRTQVLEPEELVVDVNNKEGIKAVIDDAVFLGLNTHYFVSG